MSKTPPALRQSVRWGERYVSSALNRKFAGILPAGIYHGFRIKPGGIMSVLVEHDAAYPDRSVAVVERDGFSLTIVMDDPGYVDIPTAGVWYVVIEAFYIETQVGYQRIVARQKIEPHHVVIGKVSVPEDGSGAVLITDEMISDDCRTDSSDITNPGLDHISAIVESMRQVQEAVWITDAPVASGERLNLPNGLKYVPGQHLLDISWDGLSCFAGQQYEECAPQEGETESSSVTMLFDVPAQSEFKVSIRGYSLESPLPSKPLINLSQKISNLEKTVAKLSDEVAYIDTQQPDETV